METYLLVLICLVPIIPLIFTADAPDAKPDPESSLRHVFRFVVLLMVVVMFGATVGGIHVLRLLRAPWWAMPLFGACMGLFTTAAIIKNHRYLQKWIAVSRSTKAAREWTDDPAG